MTREPMDDRKRWTSPMVVLLAAGVLAAVPAVRAETAACAASEAWVTAPSLPTEIPDGGNDFCDFYQFGWQAFLYLVSPSSGAAGERNFQVWQEYPILQASGEDSCTSEPSVPQLFVRTLKAAEDDEEFVLPERIGQAGRNEATIYDQSSNVVYYDVRFGRGLCSAPTTGNLPAGTTEIKTAWRVLADGGTGYFTMEAVIEGVSSGPLQLGLVGFHLFRTTAEHPEGVWLTWEHSANAPDCLDPQAPPAAGWSFTSPECAACLAGSTTGPLGCASCAFNQAAAETSLTGTPTEICTVYPDGTSDADHEATENLEDVDGLNDQLVGPGGILTSLPADDPMAVWANYRNVGGLWVSDPSQPATSGNQRGSIQLANPTMETTFQGDFKSTGSGFVRTSAVNCFGCHQYTPGSTRTSGLSHIVDDLQGSGATARAQRSLLRFVASGGPAADGSGKSPGPDEGGLE